MITKIKKLVEILNKIKTELECEKKSKVYSLYNGNEDADDYSEKEEVVDVLEEVVDLLDDCISQLRSLV